MNIGSQIRKLRRERDWTQAELAERIGIDKRNISRYESGHADPRRKTLLKLAEVFNVDVQELLGVSASTGEEVCDDPELQSLVYEISKLPERDKEALKHIMKAVVQKHRVTAALAS